MPLLFYWLRKNYLADMEERSPGTCSLYQNSPTMLRTEPDDTIWAFTRRDDGVYVLAVRGTIERIFENDPHPDYGIHRILLDPSRIIYFDVDNGHNVEPVIRSLSIRAQAEKLGMSFQGHAGVRNITRADNEMLKKFAKPLPVLSRH